jgi:hypothetical protein
MKIVLREYLRMLKEDQELDRFLADLLFCMGFTNISTPQKGTRQYGVDISSRGKDPDTKKEKLFLFVVKRGDITRASWDGNEQAIRSSLDEIFDVYLNRCVDVAHNNLPKKIVLCSGGEMQQAVQLNWTGYTQQKFSDTGVEFEFWGGEKLANLAIDEEFGHNILPKEMKSNLWKTLALLNQPDYDLLHFYEMLQNVFSSAQFLNYDPKKRRIEVQKCFKRVNVCLHILFIWSNDADNVKPAYLAAERVVLQGWGLLHQLDLCNDEEIISEYNNFWRTFLQIANYWYTKIAPLCAMKDGFFHYGRYDEFEYPLRIFDIMGIFGIFGLFLCTLEDQKSTCSSVATELIHLIENNAPSYNPLYDSHYIDIYIAICFLLVQGHKDFVVEWLRNMVRKIAFAYTMCGRHFPIWTDSYEDLLLLRRTHGEENEKLKQELSKTSTLLPLIAMFCLVLNHEETYQEIRELALTVFPHTNFQIWYPDNNTETYFYKKFAGSTGATFCSLEFPKSVHEFGENIRNIQQHADKFFDASSFSAHGMPIIQFLASRHYRTPILLPIKDIRELENSLQKSAQILHTSS